MRLVYANAHDAYDDAAYYIDGKLIGRESQINLHFDVFPKLDGQTIQYQMVEIPLDPDDPYGDNFFWPEFWPDLMEADDE